MQDWLKTEPILLASGRGSVLRDIQGRRYLDANASIWTNLHGHNHPKINAAIRQQLGKIAHSSALGFANEPASRLAEKLVRLANPACLAAQESSRTSSLARRTPQPRTATPVSTASLPKVFFSDDGSTAVEVALKLAYEYARRSGNPRPRFLSLDGAYHGDTVGAVSLGQIPLFHQAYSGLLFKTDKAVAPYCYRCRFNQARPQRADAREYRRCNWECLGQLENRFRSQKKKGNPYAAFVFEPLMQGAAGMIPQPSGWLRTAADIARAHGAQLVADEVMTGFGRTGTGGIPGSVGAPAGPRRGKPGTAPLFACHLEGVQPDFMALAKGLTGGYLPMAATLTTQPVFDAFLGEYSDFKTFFHGHSFTGNQLGASAALASIGLLTSKACAQARARLEADLRKQLQTLWVHPHVGDIRQVGLIAGIELVRDWRTREPFDLREQAGIRVCQLMARRGVLTRPIGNVLVLMPPYCTTSEQLAEMISVMGEALAAESKT